EVEHDAVVTGEQTVAENTETPGVVVSRALDFRDALQVRRLHDANLRAGAYGGAHRTTLLRGLLVTQQWMQHAKVLPAFGLGGGSAEQIGRMISHDQREARVAVAVNDPAKATDRFVRPQQVLRRNAADREQRTRANQRD